VPTYQTPGVYVEEVSFSAPTIEGVGTTTTAFAGPTLTGPIGGVPYGGLPASGSATAGAPAGGVPQLLTSFGDFQNIYGGYANLSLATSAANPAKDINYLAMAVQAFFTNGGSELYVSRVFANKAGSSAGTIDPGIATSDASSSTSVVVAGRFPGAFLNGQQVTVSLTATRALNFNNLASLPPGSLLGEPASGGGSATFFANGSGTAFNSDAATPVELTASNIPAKLYVLTVQVTAPGAAGQELVYSGLGLDPLHPSYIGNVLGVNPPRPIDQLQNQVWFEIGSSLNTAEALFKVLFPTWNDPSATPATPTAPATFTLSGGNDGAEPSATDYTTPLQYLKALEDIAIVATPGSSIYADSKDIMMGSLIPHVEAQRAYRVAILEAGPNLLDSDYESVRAQIDSSYAALYVPWVYTPNPQAVSGTSSPAQILVPPSGFMAGIYARNDTQKSVAKAPANEVVLGAVDFERHINFAEQAVLNPLGINCLRFFPDRGFRVWGARTVSSDSELKYINVRRYLIYLEHSIDNGTQWAVFENNGPSLWARVTDSIDSFLNNEFAEGNLLGTSPSDAYFVRCDRTTMTQNDLDNGRLVCLVGVALLKPAEFVIFRIGQMTATARS
jgi:phage tail sheath protein FI